MRPVRVRINKGLAESGQVIYIGRHCYRGGYQLPKSIWMNPFPLKNYSNRKDCLDDYYRYLIEKPELLARLPELSGKTIACFCETNELCHGDVLIYLGQHHGLWS